MIMKMKTAWIVLNTSLVVLLVGALMWLASIPRQSPPDLTDPGKGLAKPDGAVLRLGLTPERDILAHSNRYRGLADYISRRLGRPVQLVTVNTYEGVLKDFEEKKIEGAFLGSLVAALAIDRLGARPIIKPQRDDGSSSYHGVIFVRDDSPITRVTQLAGRSIAMVRTTTAGHIFPGCVIMRLGLWERPDQPRITWLGTHDDVAMQVMEGRADVGAIKNLRLEALLKSHPEWTIRRLARGKDVPNNALVLRGDVAGDLGPTLSNVLLTMGANPQGQAALRDMGVVRFVPCKHIDFLPLYNMVDCVLPAWKQIGVPGPPPRRPESWPRLDPKVSQPCYVENF